MNQLVKENNLGTSRSKLILITSGSICFVVGTYLLIKNRNHITKLLKSENSKLETTAIEKNPNVCKKSAYLKVSQAKFKSRVPVSPLTHDKKLSESRERVLKDLKEIDLVSDQSLKEKRNAIDKWWRNREAETKKNPTKTNSTYTGQKKQKDNQDSNNSESGVDLKDTEVKIEQNFSQLSSNELFTQFASANLSISQKSEIIKLLVKAQPVHLPQFIYLLESSFTKHTNPDLFSMYTFINTNGESYTDMLIRLLEIISDLTSKTDDAKLKVIFQFDQLVSLFFIYILDFEKNKNNTKRRTKLDKIKHLALRILSNLVNYTNSSSTREYDTSEKKFVQAILSKEYEISKISSPKLVTFQKENASSQMNNTLVCLNLIENLLKSCLWLDFNIDDFGANSIFNQLKSSVLIDNLDKLEKAEPKFKSQIDCLLDLLTKLKEKQSKLINQDENITVQIQEIFTEIKQEVPEAVKIFNHNEISISSNDDPGNNLDIVCSFKTL